HAPGAHYTIDGQQPPGYEVPVLHALNSTIGLDVVIDGYRDPDELYIYLPGGTVDANLTTTSDGSIQIDGKAGLTGFNSSAPNIITANILSGGVTMTPLGTYDSVLSDHNNLYLLGSQAQDALTVHNPTQVKIAANAIGGNQTRFDFALGGANGFT